MKKIFKKFGINFTLDQFCYMFLPKAIKDIIEGSELEEKDLEKYAGNSYFDCFIENWENNNPPQGYGHDPRLKIKKNLKMKIVKNYEFYVMPVEYAPFKF